MLGIIRLARELVGQKFCQVHRVHAFDCSHHVGSLSSKLKTRRKKPCAPLEQVISCSVVLFKMQMTDNNLE